MKIKLTAPDGYMYYDSLTERAYSEVITDEKSRARFSLVPAEPKPIKE